LESNFRRKNLPPVVLVQAVLIVGIIVTSALDLRDLRRRRGSDQPEAV
jgi:hypothetical protein